MEIQGGLETQDNSLREVW